MKNKILSRGIQSAALDAKLILRTEKSAEIVEKATQAYDTTNSDAVIEQEYMEFYRGFRMSAYAALLLSGMFPTANVDPLGKLHLLTLDDSGLDVKKVDEGEAIPFVQGTARRGDVVGQKFAAIAGVTAEVLRHSLNFTPLVRHQFDVQLSKKLDGVLLAALSGAQAGTGTDKAGIHKQVIELGVDGVFLGSGESIDALQNDFDAANNTLFGHQVIYLPGVANKELYFLPAGAVMLAKFAANFESAMEATVHQDDQPSKDISGASKVSSAFQVDSTYIRLIVSGVAAAALFNDQIIKFTRA